MRLSFTAAAAAPFLFSVLLAIWGGWLLLTDDPDGGRHPVGAVMIVVALILALLALLSIRRSRRPPQA